MKPTQVARERDARGVCIICESPDSQRRFGLCQAHYTRYRKQLAQVPEEERAAFRQHLVDSGLLLPKKKGGRQVPDEQNEFAQAAAAFLAERKRLLSTPGAAEAMASEAAEAAAQHASVKPTKRRQKKP